MDIRFDNGHPSGLLYFEMSTDPAGWDAWQEWQGLAFVRVRSAVRSLDEFRSTVLVERT
jgi:hypothetical protein